ncbi:MAG: Ig-like domain-containing protein [Patescibacteria group bacterium]|nr:Ig-like domain-containing protein [Patescibacteria group bacterium]MBU2250597.1 Ig-like domain-containing protein [Patescibacteria group bacterium]
MLKIIKKISIFICLLVVAMTLAHFAFALDTGIQYGVGTGLGQEDPRIIVAKIIRIVIGFLGIIAVGLVLYAGWLWMTSDGEEDKVEKAKMILRNALIGLIIILSSFAIVSFILNKLVGATSGGTGVGGGSGGGVSGGIAALGSGIIETHYPGRNQKAVPRNTSISITFKEPINPASIIAGNKINVQNVKIYKTKDGLTGPMVVNVIASSTANNKTFIFKPTQYLGSAAENFWYTVALSKDIKKATRNEPAFGALSSLFPYDWTFEVSTIIDETPPKIESIIPMSSATEPRNVVIQVNFNEAVNPLSASGATKDGFNNITVVASGTSGSLVAGNFYLSNQYKTVEFLTEDKCGTNSCGLDVYCLPGNKDLSVVVKADTSLTSLYDGVVDMADNSLDGNGDGIAQGSAVDNYAWSFKTSNAVDTSPPVITKIEPNINALGVSLSSEVKAEFSKLMMSNSLNSDSFNLVGTPVVNYWISKTDNASTSKTTVIFNHDQFNEDKSYSPKITSAVKDVYQNCYFPCSGVGATGVNVAGSPSCCNGAENARSSCQ